jgi:arsenite methyltransferase
MIKDRPYESTAIRAVTGPAIRPGGLALTRRAAAYCRLAPGDRIVDVGCGSGATVGFLNRYICARAVGLDLSAMLLGEGRRRDRDMPLVRGSAEALPVRRASLAAVFCECVLSLLPAPETVLRDIYRALQTGGYMVVADLYWRDRVPAATPATRGARDCLGGAVSRETMARWTGAAGFDLCLWEDHTPLLKTMAAQLAWAGVSLLQWWPGGCTRYALGGAGCPGYFLMIARKRTPTHG